jgi:hypothetical protein
MASPQKDRKSFCKEGGVRGELSTVKVDVIAKQR